MYLKMSYNRKNLLIFVIGISCCLPFISGRHHHKHHHENFNGRSSSSTAEQPLAADQATELKATVKRATANFSKVGGVATEPMLKSVNIELNGPKHTSGSGGIPVVNNKNLHVNVNALTNLPASPNIGTIHDDHTLLDTEVFKKLLRDLLTRLDEFAIHDKESHAAAAAAVYNINSQLNSVLGGEGPRHINAINARHCTLHGLWLSTVAGAAIELVPQQLQDHIEIHTRIFELPDNPFPPLINSQWTGKGIISPESPTTITIVFQEHVDAEKENHAKEKGLEKDGNSNDDSSAIIQLPRTAVFVGQCLVCQGNPTLQGAWVVFPATQTCTNGGGLLGGGTNSVETKPEQLQDSNRLSTPDAIYLLQYY